MEKRPLFPPGRAVRSCRDTTGPASQASPQTLCVAPTVILLGKYPLPHAKEDSQAKLLDEQIFLIFLRVNGRITAKFGQVQHESRSTASNAARYHQGPGLSRNTHHPGTEQTLPPTTGRRSQSSRGGCRPASLHHVRDSGVHKSRTYNDRHSHTILSPANPQFLESVAADMKKGLFASLGICSLFELSRFQKVHGRCAVL